ncbi:hypothetical protein PO883_19520 [Massilia sp. DJPM01]|uniref:hypothetical protein n=1 Tax=Massilia sp. DJPM01 TaxID=3024404 RepID=UPI00259F421D|nr:hypothetical protein [Massilia sp. DJPM01]MDM5179385.1 hypothetical protein [Massilia sp. DJPM01]
MINNATEPLRGFGKIEAPARKHAYAITQLRADVIGLFDALEIERVLLVAAIGER